MGVERAVSTRACSHTIAALAMAMGLVAASCAGGSSLATDTAEDVAQSSPPKLEHHEILPKDLPAPNTSHEAVNPPRVVPRPDGAELLLPPGFEIETYAEGGFKRPRMLALAPNGDVFVSDSEARQIIVLRDANSDGKVDERHVFATDLMQPFGMAFGDGVLFVGNTNAVVKFAYKPGQTKAEGAPQKVADLPGRGYREHWTRNVVLSPDRKRLYASVGSESNVSPEDDPRRASVVSMNPDGSDFTIVARGLRNPVGLAFNPVTGKLWAAVQERDKLGDDLPPDYVTEVRPGAFYGWPYAYIGPNVDPRRRGEETELAKTTSVPDVLVQAHSAVLGLVFYQGTMFPEEYRGDAFVAFHGSWNRTLRTGYKIVRIPFEAGRPTGGYDDFVVGWMLDGARREVWGRPVGLLVLPDGSMLITDDGLDMIYRITYRAPTKPPGKAPGNGNS